MRRSLNTCHAFCARRAAGLAYHLDRARTPKIRSMVRQPTLWHSCGWIERIPGGTRQNDGLETGIMGGYGRKINVATRASADIMPRN